MVAYKMKIRVYRNPLKQMYKLVAPGIEMFVTPTAIYNSTMIIAVGETARNLYQAVYYHDKNKLRAVLPTILETAKLLA
jgi:hypothetical protein